MTALRGCNCTKKFISFLVNLRIPCVERRRERKKLAAARRSSATTDLSIYIDYRSTNRKLPLGAKFSFQTNSHLHFSLIKRSREKYYVLIFYSGINKFEKNKFPTKGHGDAAVGNKICNPVFSRISTAKVDYSFC